MLKNNTIDIDEWSFDDIKVGYETDSISFSVSSEDVDSFAKISGDYNSLHMDDTFAQDRGYSKRVVHGILLASKFSFLVGMVIPGKNCLYLSQEVRFHKPVYVNDVCSLKGTVISKSESTKVLEIKTEIFNDDGVLVVSGVAKVQIA